MQRLTMLGILLLSGCSGPGFPSTEQGAMDAGAVDVSAAALFDAAPQTFRIQDTDGEWKNLPATDYQVAVKSLSLVTLTGKEVPVMHAERLAESQVLSFSSGSSEVPMASVTLPLDAYVAAKFSLYYVQMNIPINGESKSVRCYLSDDDFPSEVPFGKGPHHQGDLTAIDTDGEEIGWIQGGNFETGLRQIPPAGEKLFASDPDEETGHDRGLYGNTAFWKAHPAKKPFTLTHFMPLLKPEVGARKKLVMHVDVRQIWHYVDADGSGDFNPKDGADAQSEETGWGPILPSFSFQ